MILNYTKIFFSRFYDDLFRLAIVNIFWLLISILTFGIAFPPATIALFDFTYKILQREDPSFKDYGLGIRKWFWKSYIVFLITVLTLGVPVYALGFYLKLLNTWGVAAYALSAICFWSIPLVLLCQVYFIPFLIHQNCSIATALKRSVMLLLMRPGLTCFALIILCPLYSLYATPGFIFCIPCAVCFLKNLTLLMALEDYEE